MASKKNVKKSNKQPKTLSRGKKLGSTRTLFQPVDGHR